MSDKPESQSEIINYDMLQKEYFTVQANYEKLYNALDEVEQYCNKYGQNSIGFKKNLLEIIKKAKISVTLSVDI